MENQEIIIKFCKLCSWTYEVWSTQRTIFDDNADLKSFEKLKCVDFLRRFNIILQEYTLLQIVKLHDPANQGINKNLSLDYIVNNIDWDQGAKSNLEKLKNRLDELLGNCLAVARRKSLCHNDFGITINNTTCGEFAKDVDMEYFEKLQEFIDIAHDKIVGGPYPFNDLAKSDTNVFISCLK